ncbi:MAG TPA: flagellar basal body L-ring protein FlgH [Sphingomonas sp.]|uniref:flagellar basal body L-ring protein FlgH n=1 Tax=Sphingomonas sp. TaxID=28214 RepID=UPI002ED9A58C
MVTGVLFAVHANPVEARKPKVPPIDYTPVAPVALPAPAGNGSIFQVSHGYASLTSGARASAVGDTLTIVLVERTQALKSNSAQTDRNGNIGLSPPTTGPLSFFQPSDVAVGGGSTFKGTGSAAQSNALTGEVTVTVAQVLPNGNMLVRGEKQVTLNRGDEFIRISGIVRPADILNDNQVLSTRVADAKITYSGSGEIARASRAGWLNRFFTRFSPF